MKMKKIVTFISWLSLLGAIACAISIPHVPTLKPFFLVLLLVNVVLPFVVHKGYGKVSLTLCRLLVGGLFIFSSFTKGIDPVGTKYKMLDYLSVYGMTWLNDFALVLAMLLIMAEFIVGICLMTKIFPRLAVLGASLLMVFFTATTLFDALYNLVPDCGCFGTVIKMTNWQTFYKNLVIDAILIPLIMNNGQLENHRLTWRKQFVIGCLYAIAFLFFEIYNYRHLPVVDFLNWKIGKQMNAEPSGDIKTYLTYRNKVTGEKQEYLSPNYPWNDSAWMSQWEFVDQRVEGGEDYLGFSALDEEGNDVTDMILSTENLLMFTSHDLSKITEIEWERIKDITHTAEEHDFTVVWVVADEPGYVESLREKMDFLNEVYYGDALEIKTIVRYNPGLIWLDNGLVKNKWSGVDFPQGRKLELLFK